VKKTSYKNLSELDSIVSSLLLHSMRNWFHSLFQKQSYSIVANFIFHKNQQQTTSSGTKNDGTVTGFRLEFLIHSKSTIRFHIHVENVRLHELSQRDIMKRTIKNELIGMHESLLQKIH
jgi:hypothetical protein